jgi:nucleoid-associated protein YgaU
MIARSSRYRQADVYPSSDPGRADHAIAGVRPHQAEPLEVRREHRVAGHERLDTLAQRYYSDPLLFWLICDANETIFPDDLMVPGRVLRIPRNKR